MRRVLFGLALALTALPALAQTEDENVTRCNSDDHDLAIIGCTALIQSGNESSENVVSAFYNRGVAYKHKGQYALAIQDYNQVIRLKPDDEDAFNARGNAYYDRGQHDLAMRDYDEAIRLNPNDENVFNSRGIAYYSLGQYDLAIQDLSEAIRLKPNGAEAFNNRAWAYHLKGENAKGLPDANKAIALAPRDAKSIETRAEIFEKLGQRDKALADYTTALKLDPNMKEAGDGLKRLTASASTRNAPEARLASSPPAHATPSKLYWTAADHDLVMSSIDMTRSRNGDYYDYVAQGSYPSRSQLGAPSPAATQIKFSMDADGVERKSEEQTQTGSWEGGSKFQMKFRVSRSIVDGAHRLNMRLCMGNGSSCHSSPNGSSSYSSPNLAQPDLWGIRYTPAH
jgi:tetratricopeptide (TPR) repeat protein